MGSTGQHVGDRRCQFQHGRKALPRIEEEAQQSRCWEKFRENSQHLARRPFSELQKNLNGLLLVDSLLASRLMFEKVVHEPFWPKVDFCTTTLAHSFLGYTFMVFEQSGSRISTPTRSQMITRSGGERRMKPVRRWRRVRAQVAEEPRV